MINLLPPQYKKGLAYQETLRLILALGISFLIFLICFILMLSVIRIYMKGQIQGGGIETKKSNSRELTQTNAEFSTLLNFYKKRLSPTSVFDHVSLDLPSEVSLSSLSIAPSGIVIEGFAPTRESLLNFRKNLGQDSFFKTIDFPIANLVNAFDINFSIRMTIYKTP